MKRSYLIALGLAFCAILVGATRLTHRAQQTPMAVMPAAAMPTGTVAASQAQNHVGQHITVEGVVSEVHASANATFIDIGGRYPDETFTGVIFGDDESGFSDLQGLEGKTVDITGTVKLYNGRPEIVLTSKDQLRIR